LTLAADFSEVPNIKFTKIRPVGAELMRTDRQMDGPTNLTAWLRWNISATLGTAVTKLNK